MHAQNCLFLALKCSNRAHSDLDKHMEALFSSAAAAWLTSRRSWHGVSFGTLTVRRREMLVGGAGTILPYCWRRSCWCQRRGWRRRGRLVELISFADSLLQGLSERSPDAQSSPLCRHKSPAFCQWKNRCEIRLW